LSKVSFLPLEAQAYRVASAGAPIMVGQMIRQSRALVIFPIPLMIRAVAAVGTFNPVTNQFGDQIRNWEIGKLGTLEFRIFLNN
jgi:hypothetical protein